MSNSEFFSFQLADALQIAVPLNHLEKIIQIPKEQICPLPGLASHWAGITNYQGSLLWILDSEQFFQVMPSRSPKKMNWTVVIITLQTPESIRRIAVSAKGLNGILSLEVSPTDTLSFPLLPQFQSLFSASILDDRGFTLVLEPESFFSSLSSSNLGLVEA